MDQTINVIKALLDVISKGSFHLTAENAAALTTIVAAAEQEIESLATLEVDTDGE